MISLDQVILWLLGYKYLAIFPLAIIEGPIITIITGFFVSLGQLNFWLAYFIIIAGDLTGDALHYLLGRWGGEKIVAKWGHYFGVNGKQVNSLEKQFDKRGGQLLFIGKMSHGIGGAFLVAAGMVKMPFGKFMLSNLLATLLKSFILLLIGYYFGRALSTISSYMERIALISIGVAIFAFLIYFFYFRKKNKIMDNPSFKEKSIQTISGQIFYYLENSFSGRPFVILLHGLSSNHTTWLNIMKTLQDNQYNYLALDLRGHGRSDKTKNKKLYRISVFTDDLRQIIDSEHIQNFILVGYSFGGQIAIAYAAKHPDNLKGLILISTNHAPPLDYLRLGFLTLLLSGFFNLLAALFFWQKLKKYHYYEHGQAVGYWDSVWDGLRTMPLAVNFWLLAQVVKINLKNEIRQIKVPTVFVFGQKDAFITKKEINEMIQAIPSSRLIISKNPSHFVGTNSQDEITQIIVNFLKQL